jgi:membrane metallo-endopeptidase-like protein 1
MYASCINEEAIEMENIDVILPFINTELGGWPILQGSEWDSSTFNLSRLLLKLTEYSNSVMFGVGTQIDQQNSSIRSIRISQNSLALGDRNYYFNENDVTRAYQQFMGDLALALTNDTSMIEDDVNDIYTFEQTIARFVWTAAEQSAQSDKTIRTTIGNLSSAINASVSISLRLFFLFPTQFDFLGYIRALYLLGNVTLTDTDIITVSELEYIRNVSLIMNQTSPRTLQNYIVWRFIMIQTANMPRRFQLIKQQFDEVYHGSNTLPTRTVYCGGYVNNIMGFAVAKLYKDEYFDTNARNQVPKIIDCRIVFSILL